MIAAFVWHRVRLRVLLLLRWVSYSAIVVSKVLIILGLGRRVHNRIVVLLDNSVGRLLWHGGRAMGWLLNLPVNDVVGVGKGSIGGVGPRGLVVLVKVRLWPRSGNVVLLMAHRNRFSISLLLLRWIRLLLRMRGEPRSVQVSLYDVIVGLCSVLARISISHPAARTHHGARQKIIGGLIWLSDRRRSCCRLRIGLVIRH